MTQNQTTPVSPFPTTDETHEAFVNGILAKLADAATSQADKGKLAIDALLTFQAYANDRVGSGKTLAYQRLVSIAQPAIKGGNAGFKNVKAFLLVMFAPTLGPLDAKGNPDAHLYSKVDNAWRHDVRQGNKDRAMGGKGKRKGGRKPVTLAACLLMVEKKFARLKSQDDRNRLKEAFDAWYAKASSIPAADAGKPALKVA